MNQQFDPDLPTNEPPHPEDHPTEILSDQDGAFRVDAPANHPKAPRVQPGWQRNLFAHNKWLLIMSLALGGIAIAVAITLAFQASQPAESPKSQRPTPTVPPVQTSHDEGDNNFFASQSLTFLYYSFSQTTNNRGTFQSTTNQEENRFLNVGFPDRYSMSTSPNGAHLIRWTPTKIEISSYQAPSTFDEFYVLEQPNGAISSVVWSKNSKSLLVAYTFDSDEDDVTSGEIVSIDVAKGQVEELIRFDDIDFQPSILARPTSRTLYYLEDRGGLLSNLTQYNLTEDKVDRRIAHFTGGAALSRVQFDADLAWGYYINDHRVIRRSVQTGRDEVMYQIDRSCSWGGENASRISWLTVAPDGARVLFGTSPAACRNNQRQSNDLRPQLVLLSTDDKKVIRQAAASSVSGEMESRWSPKSDYVWAQSDTQTAHLIRVENLSSLPVPPAEQQALTKERVVFLGWLAKQ